MKIESIKRWQWILISLGVGIVVGAVRWSLGSVELDSFNNSINSQSIFESAMRGKVSANGAMHDQAQNIRVFWAQHPQDPQKRNTYIVTFGYCRWAEEDAQGKRKWVWRPSAYATAPGEPFKPFFRVQQAVAPQLTLGERIGRMAESIGLKQKEPPDSVLAYLRTLRATDRNLQFSYPWWNQGRATMGIWTVGSFVVIGLIWPTIVNLIVFGSLFRPRDKSEIDLSKVKNVPLAVGAKASLTQADLDELARLEAELEKKLADSDEGPSADDAPATVAAKSAAPEIRKLTATQLEKSMAGDEHKEEVAFGTDQDDFYPTQRHAHPQKPGKPHE